MNWTKVAEDVLTAGLAAIPSFLGSAASSGMDYYQTRNLMDYQQRLNQQMIHSANRYNSPLAQMQRLEAAGLNKNLVYGSGVDGNQSSPGSVGLGKSNPQLEIPIAENYFRKKQLENETRLTQANEGNILSNKALTEAKTLHELIQVAKEDATFNTYVEQQAANLKHTYQSIDESKQRVEESKQRQDESSQRTNNLKIVANNLIEEGNLLAEKRNLTKEQALTEAVKRKSIEAGIELTNAQAEQVGSYIQFIEEGTKLRKIAGKAADLNFDVEKIYKQWKKEHPNATLTLEMMKDISEIFKNFASGVGVLVP